MTRRGGAQSAVLRANTSTYLYAVREKLKNAPKLIPIYSHRYIPMTSDKNPPILSISGVDIIYYGVDLKDYLNVEFGGKKQADIQYYNMASHVDFWSDSNGLAGSAGISGSKIEVSVPKSFGIHERKRVILWYNTWCNTNDKEKIER